MSKADAYPTVDESRDRLHRAGWSLGETCFGSTWQVDGSNGENRLLATGDTQAEAWWGACIQAREMGMLAPARDEETVPSEDSEPFQKLAGVIRQQLTGVKVYKIGDEPERDVYIVGKASDGQLAGLKTKVVET